MSSCTTRLRSCHHPSPFHLRDTVCVGRSMIVSVWREKSQNIRKCQRTMEQEGVSVFYISPSFDPSYQWHQTLLNCLRAVGGWSGSLLCCAANQSSRGKKSEKQRQSFKQLGEKGKSVGWIYKFHILQCRIMYKVGGREWRPGVWEETVSRSPNPNKDPVFQVYFMWTLEFWTQSLHCQWIISLNIYSGSNPFLLKYYGCPTWASQ